jgi:hypothetical protein
MPTINATRISIPDWTPSIQDRSGEIALSRIGQLEFGLERNPMDPQR